LTAKQVFDAKPLWLKKRVSLNNSNIEEVKELLANLNLNTVCQSAKCPNIFECFSKRTATFMLLGSTCTRNCAFCGVLPGKPQMPDPKEPANIAEASFRLGLMYIVLTSVTRDDLKDGGAVCFYNTLKQIKIIIPGAKVECLIPDFGGSRGSLELVLDAKPDVLNHNIETVKRNYGPIRKGADYYRSLGILKNAKKIMPGIIIKSGFMLGLGETGDEIKELILDLREAGCDILTIGQYLRPSGNNFKVSKYYTPQEFESIKNFADSQDFKYVVSGSYVRSSYHASAAYNYAKINE